MSDKPKLGEILVQAGVIDEMQLAAALGEQSRWGRRLGVTLIKLGMVDETDLVRALAKQLGLPVASLSGKRIADEVIALVPADMASEYGVIPLFVKDEGPKPTLFLGMEDPSNLAVLDDLSFRTGMTVSPVMIGPSELGEALDRYYLGHPDASPAATPTGSARGGEPIGERNLRVMQKDASTASSHAPDESLPPVSRDTEIQFTAAPAALPEGLLEDVATAVAESQKTRHVARAIAQLLVEKGIVSLEELQARIARQKEGASS